MIRPVCAVFVNVVCWRPTTTHEITNGAKGETAAQAVELMGSAGLRYVEDRT